MRDKPFVLVITGPTASGKTALAMSLAASLSLEVINADSMQVYRGMDIGTAKPVAAEREQVRHHLIDIREPGEDFSVGEYTELFRAAVKDVAGRGRLPVAVGGTGLYIRGALGGLFPGPARDEAVRTSFQEQESAEPGTLFRLLGEVDPETAGRTRPEDLVRIIRALEVYQLTGIPISEHQKEHAFSDRPFKSRIVCLEPPRELLYSWIDARVDAMMETGFLEEVRKLRERGYGPELNSMKALGYRELQSFLDGQVELPEAVELIKRNTRRYAKRQLTWFRGEEDVTWLQFTDRAGVTALAEKVIGELGITGLG
jgi:tRNA dimethylallyltransferase